MRYRAVVEFDTLYRVAPVLLPVACLEASRGPPRDLAKVVVVPDERRDKLVVLQPLLRRANTPDPAFFLHIRNHGVAELTALDLGRALHQACEIVSDFLLPDCRVHAADNGIRSLGPAHVAQHHLTGQEPGSPD